MGLYKIKNHVTQVEIHTQGRWYHVYTRTHEISRDLLACYDPLKNLIWLND